MNIKWSILCIGVSDRLPKSGHLIYELTKQITQSDIEFLMLIDNEKSSIDKKRNQLLQIAQGDYVNFVDDDDEVSSDYVESIYPLLDGTDYIGFKVAHFNKGERTKPVRHSLEYASWNEDENGYYRNVSHLNPIRKELALIHPFEGTFGEDERWSMKIYSTGKVKSQHFIDKELYYYYSDTDKSKAYKNKEKK